jgi:primase-polymerase (primpol)-like protein
LGKAASSTNPRTWSSFDVAAASSVGDGLGFVLNGDGIACVDLDHCINGGVLEPWAQAILDRTPATYVEVSPSGTGLHIFGFATVGAGRNLGGVEFYDRGRYMTVTGKRWGKSPRVLADISGLIASL